MKAASRPITDEAPDGSILNPNAWTAGNSRNLIGHVIPSLIFKALEGVVPKGHGRQRRRADLGRQLRRPARRRYPIRLGPELPWRARRAPEFDGLDTLSFPSNCKVTAIEMFEIAVPVLTECKELIPDSGGAGKYRGGLGQRVVLRNLGKSPMSIYLASERVRHPCFGVVGGESGRRARCLNTASRNSRRARLFLRPANAFRSKRRVAAAGARRPIAPSA